MGRSLTDIDHEIECCVPKGWHNLLKAAARSMLKRGWSGEFRQIKEKFGGLRVYIGPDDYAIPEVREIAESAESISNYMCQDCGASPADCVSIKHWLTTLCDDCVAKLGGRP